jgi:hypothetical protein
MLHASPGDNDGEQFHERAVDIGHSWIATRAEPFYDLCCMHKGT